MTEPIACKEDLIKDVLEKKFTIEDLFKAFEAGSALIYKAGSIEDIRDNPSMSFARWYNTILKNIKV